MPISAGTIVDKISEVRSKIAVFEGLVLHLKSNYLPSDAGDPEMKFYRGDYAPVPAPHVEASIGDVEHHLLDLREQLAQWEGIIVEMENTTSLNVKGMAVTRKNRKETTDGTPR
jgi:hypothetical protein